VSGPSDEGRGIRISRVELFAGAGFVLLLAVGVLRMGVPDRHAMRPVSVEGIDIPTEPIASGQVLTREKDWRPSVDVYVVGWSYSVGALQAAPDVLLRHGQTVLFFGPRGGAATQNPAFLDAGLGYRLPAGEPLTLQLSMANSGPPGETAGVRALVYFVPVAGN
jgi:hypothetical protein